MLKLGAIALVIVATLFIGIINIRQRRKIARREEKVHQLYLRSKRRDWLARWLGRGKAKRLTYRAGDSE